MKSMRYDHASSRPSFSRRLPPMHALEVFVTAVRCGTFSRTASEMFVTQSAISRQVQQLEDNLGVQLFIRHKRGLRLTPEAESLLPIVEDAFTRIARACSNLRNSGQVLTLRMPPTLATRWFLPILPSLQAMLPDLDVRLTTYDAWEPSFETSDIDAAIVQGRGDWPDVEAIPLFPELLTPVSSPDLARHLATPDMLCDKPLLHCFPLNGWPLWLEAANAQDIASHRGQIFDTLELALSAATRGQGVALGDVNLIQESLRDGVLVRPFSIVVDRGVSYYLVFPKARGQVPKIAALKQWLEEAAERQRQAYGSLQLVRVPTHD
ncbi:LysR substrate-binding domain-containing protein [Shinella sp.]|uniref:LysR substrate-binding domain-containing protein n=1 Tax=Shinella sp. TaxID=1870904 RepID=UPI00403716D8